ncbi:hypothetical protein QMK50_24180 [Pseudomonas sp. P5_152]|uniref:hypothetical protein n=1 Tax=Pseudomonas sp. P5_152 TaxID=3043442 RepID=UPI002A36396B|nr:hypothetical protein [Pseudomonas sp. P5_152]MDX9668051.1 hypothetical protein [Pseudomonas sp. P5_152]
MDLVVFSEKYSGIVGVIVTIAIGLIGLFHYLSIKRAEERGRQYDRYHKLLEDLNISPQGDAPFIDRQLAVVFEMRNFPEYFPVSLRILKRSLPRWKSLLDGSRMTAPMFKTAVNTLFDEAVLTIKYIERKQNERSYLCSDTENV